MSQKTKTHDRRKSSAHTRSRNECLKAYSRNSETANQQDESIASAETAGSLQNVLWRMKCQNLSRPSFAYPSPHPEVFQMSTFVIQASTMYTQEPVQAISAATATSRCSCRTFEAQRSKATNASKRVCLASFKYKT